jgi:levansucrase
LTRDDCRAEPVRWTSDQVRRIGLEPGHVAPLIGDGDVQRVCDEIDIWDAWPVQRRDGFPAVLDHGVTLWMALGSPRFADPDERHNHARLHLLARTGGEWSHLGPVMPDGFSPGSREWSGSAVLDPGDCEVDLYFTATGHRGEATPTFTQRLFRARSTLDRAGGAWRFRNWRDLSELVTQDTTMYMPTDAACGGPGTIKAFRDPAYFHDPVSGAHFAFFAGSQAGSRSSFNGVIGAAVSGSPGAGDWGLLPPLVSADGLNNELERPHVIRHEGCYYLFWSTQGQVFDPAGPVGPTGLYGMVSDRLRGGWRPLNGTGLVFANPPEAPAQAYSWLVLPDRTVVSFVDDWGPAEKGRPRRFGGTFAPVLRLALDGASARLAD